MKLTAKPDSSILHIMQRFEEFATHYRARIFPKQRWKKWLRNDLQIIKDHDDLGQVTLELLDYEGKRLGEFTLEANGAPVGELMTERERSGTWPRLPGPLDRHRMVIKRRTPHRLADYEANLVLLWRTWTPPSGASPSPASNSSSVPVPVKDFLHKRHRLVITRAGTKGFAFGNAPQVPGLTDVFLHVTHANGVEFQVGSHVTARVIEVIQNGESKLQAREIRPA